MMSTPLQEKKYWIALAHCEALTPLYWKRLFDVFPSAEAIWHASQKDLEATGITSRVAAELIALRGTVDPDAAMARMEKEQLHAVILPEESYPRLLKEITDPPAVLFFQGVVGAEETVGALGVVGTRKISSYGHATLPPIIAECVGAGLTIVSGLALGIDGVAHETTIKNSGRTIAVIGSGIDRKNLYPWQHKQLADRIVGSGGAIVSEYPPGTPPIAYHFPARNRIISGMSHGVLVCEAPQKSGALITAYAALDQNREVFAVPGPIQHPNSYGPHDLLKRGAILTTCADDILRTLTLPIMQKNTMETKTSTENTAHKNTTPTSATEETLVTILQDDVLHIDELVRRSNLTAEAIMSTLVLMEMRGLVRHVGNSQYTTHGK
ncbi:DNA-protecting protein DprA [Candidatus Uhrbacteria bacterium]|nr:DNA-protecting protein DprA [Candidatus Uhrbacteria bacterium]